MGLLSITATLHRFSISIFVGLRLVAVQQMLEFLTESWLMGTLSAETVIKIFSWRRLCTFNTFPFWHSLGHLFVNLVQRSQRATTPATIQKLLSGSQQVRLNILVSETTQVVLACPFACTVNLIMT